MSLPSVMISYNQKASSNLAIKLNKTLKRHHINTWIDVDDMGSDIFISMATGIEKSDILLILLSNEYCRSENCIRECGYAVNQRKHLIPIKTEENYKPSGSVGLITSTLLYIDFTKKNCNR